jgi:hypothetical protein
MNDSIPLTISKSERAELEALLDAYIAEIRKDRGEHERVMARVDERLKQTRRYLEQIRANLETPCGKSSSR